MHINLVHRQIISKLSHYTLSYLHRIGPAIPGMFRTVGISGSPMHMGLDQPVPTVQASTLYRDMVLRRHRHYDWNHKENPALIILYRNLVLQTENTALMIPLRNLIFGRQRHYDLQLKIRFKYFRELQSSS